jgi:hypothetical protein
MSALGVVVDAGEQRFLQLRTRLLEVPMERFAITVCCEHAFQSAGQLPAVGQALFITPMDRERRLTTLGC